MQAVFLTDHMDESAELSEYATVKVGDWGEATVTTLTNENNSRDMQNRGTYVWQPPVSDPVLPQILLEKS